MRLRFDLFSLLIIYVWHTPVSVEVRVGHQHVWSSYDGCYGYGGLVEVKFNGVWQTVCDDDWDDNDAR